MSRASTAGDKRVRPSFKAFIAVGALAGLGFPALCLASGGKIDSSWQGQMIVVLWPLSIGMMATHGAETFSEVLPILTVTLVSNVLLYAVLAGLLWWGLYRQRWVLYTGVPLLLFGWFSFVQSIL